MENKEEIKVFIEKHKDKDSAELSLLLAKRKDLPKTFLINQIVGRQKAIKKFPFLIEHKDFIYPPSRAIEQASSEDLAKFKSNLYSGQTMADLSGGMGMDSIFWSRQFNELKYVERDEELAKISQQNFKSLGLDNVSVFSGNAENYLKTIERLDLIYIDPDRRDKTKRLFLIEDCSPNLIALEDLLISKSQKVLVKLSPMLDIQAVKDKLKSTQRILVVSYKNECKEILVEFSREVNDGLQIECVNIQANQIEQFSFHIDEEKNALIEYSKPLQYLYEPNSSILKAGAFKLYAHNYGLKKIALNTHLYTSDERIPNSNARCFSIQEEVKLKHISKRNINVICRNYPIGVNELKKKYKLKDGGSQFLLAFSDMEGKARHFIAELID